MAKKWEKFAAYGLLCIMMAALLPVMYLGRYNHPTGDDYYYGADTKRMWEETGSMLQTVAEAARGVAYQYENWQGTYSAMLLMYLPPNLFGDYAYGLVTAVILILLTGSIFWLLKPVICGLLKGTTELWIMISSLLTILCVETVPTPGESFFWYNGSMYYTGYYALTLFFFGMVLRYAAKPKGYRLFIMGVSALFLAGGNYVSLLPALLIMLIATVLLFRYRPNGYGGIGGITLLLTCGFLINVLAPGNQVRKDGMWSIPAWKAVLKSLLQGVHYIRAWTGIWLLLALMILTPFLWRTFSPRKIQFRHLLLVIGLAYGIFCSMSCPTFYTMNSTGPGRVVAVVYYGFLLFVFAVWILTVGYVHGLMAERRCFAVARISETGGKIIKGAAAGLCAALFLGLIVSGELRDSTTGKAVRLLKSGEAAAYDREYRERLRILADDSVTDVVFSPYENQPEMLYVGDFDGDPQHETNRKAARYFHKSGIRVLY